MAWKPRPGRVHCDAVKRDGEPCGGWAMEGKSKCPSHEPAVNARRGRAVSGVRSSSVQSLGKFVRTGPGVIDISNALVRAMLDVHQHRISPPQGSAIAALGTAAVRAFQTTELEKRIAALEAMREDEVRDIVDVVWTDAPSPDEAQSDSEAPSEGEAD